MAYIIDGNGPFANKAGEFCWNGYRPEKECFYMFRYGRPQPSPNCSLEEMEKKGQAGVYFAVTCPLPPGAVEVETPDELKEPDGPCPQWILDLNRCP